MVQRLKADRVCLYFTVSYTQWFKGSKQIEFVYILQSPTLSGSKAQSRSSLFIFYSLLNSVVQRLKADRVCLYFTVSYTQWFKGSKQIEFVYILQSPKLSGSKAQSRSSLFIFYSLLNSVVQRLKADRVCLYFTVSYTQWFKGLKQIEFVYILQSPKLSGSKAQSRSSLFIFYSLLNSVVQRLKADRVCLYFTVS